VDRHWDGARRTAVVIGSGMVLVIMAVESSRKAGADRLRDSANALGGHVGDAGDHGRHHVENGSGDHGGGSSRGSR
jgi:hypothetical protein